MNHTRHWLTVLGDEASIERHIDHVLKTGNLLWDGEYMAEGQYLVGNEEPVSAVTIRTHPDKEPESSYPILEEPEKETKNEFQVHTLKPIMEEDGSSHEGIVRLLAKDGFEIEVFCAVYNCLQTILTNGHRYIWSLAAFAYTLNKVEGYPELDQKMFSAGPKIQEKKGDSDSDHPDFRSIRLQMEGGRYYVDQGDADFEFQSVVEEVLPYEGLYGEGCIIQLNLRPDGDEPVRVRIYASNKVLDSYKPAEGDSVAGTAWLQGGPIGPSEDQTSLMDIGLPNDASGMPNGLLVGVSYLYSNPQLPLALQIVGAAFLTDGWEVDCQEGVLFRKKHPAFSVRKGDQRLLLYVDTKSESCSNRESLSEEQRQINRLKALDQGMGCLHLTVLLDPVDDGFNISVEGLDEFSDEIFPLSFARRPEFLKPASMNEELEEKRELPFDDAMAVESYVRGLNEGDLTGLSKLLVEDVLYINAPSKVIIRGRHDLLSFLGRHISGKKTKSQMSIFKAGTGVYEGVLRHFAFSFQDDQEEPGGCTFFSSGKNRNGFVSMIRCVHPNELESYQLTANT